MTSEAMVPVRHPRVFNTRLTEMLHVEHPIMLAGMAGISLHKLVAAVCNAGGFGCMGGGAVSPARLREEMRKVKALTDKPFGVDILAHDPRMDALIEVIIEEGASVFITGRGTEPRVIARCKKAGLRLGCVCGALKHAISAVELGYDFVIVQGTEGGGHTGYVSLFPLLPQVIDAVGHKVPVVAAGGIYDGRGLAAALALGADGVWCGTRFLMSQEAVAVKGYKERALHAEAEDTVLTSGYTGKNCRVLKNAFTERVDASGLSSKDYFKRLTLDDIRAVTHLGKDETFAADVDTEFMPIGQVIGAIKDVPPAADIVVGMVAQAATTLRGLGRSML